MPLAGMLLSCCLLGQAVAPMETPANGADSVPAGVSTPSSEPQRIRRQPPEMVAEALTMPAGAALNGQPLTLLNVLTASPDRRMQLELTRLYWHLAQATAEYRYAFDYAKLLEDAAADGESAAMRFAHASAVASLRQCEVEANRFQCELARWMKMPANASLPLPADSPHVGPYHTKYQELFGGRTPPESATLIQRLLPVLQKAVDEQAAAVQAAEDALAAAQEDRSSGRADAATIAQCGKQLFDCQRAFIHTVCDYNRNIAEYGLLVAARATSPQALTAMLIGPAKSSVSPSMPSDMEKQVQPTGGAEPIDAPSWQSTGAKPTAAPTMEVNEPTPAPPRELFNRNEPTPAPPRELFNQNEPTPAPPRELFNRNEPTPAPPRELFNRNEPTPAPPREGLLPTSNEEPVSTFPRNELRRMGDAAPSLNPVDAEVETGSVELDDKPMVPVEMPSDSAERRTARKPVLSTASDGSLESICPPLYPGLTDAKPAARAKQLTVALHWDRSLPEGIGRPMSLTDCLMRDPGADRRATLVAYWLVRQRAGEFQSQAQRVELLDSLVPLVLERRNDPSGPSDMLRLQTAQRVAKAEQRLAQAALIEAQYDLAVRIGAVRDDAWPLASTLPHSGGYLLKLDAQPQSLIESWPMRHLSRAIPALTESVWQRAAAVVEADVVRATAAENYRTGSATIDDAIDGVNAMTEQSLKLLALLSEYNGAIADYALAVLPPNAPAAQLAAALVVKP